MAKCNGCINKAVIVSEKSFCGNHFVKHFENKVLKTIKRFNLIKEEDKIIVGSSGGKDSTTILYILKKYFGNVEALAIDEGIPGYRNITLESLKKFCKEYSVPLHIYSYKSEFGFSLTEALKVNKELKPCNICGTLRRYLLNTKARCFDKIATGHNLDDEAQSIMMNLVKAQLPLLSRLGPITGNVADDGFVPRIKPLYFCTEKEVATYAVIKQFSARFNQCPHSVNSFRASIRDQLNEYEVKNRGSKVRVVNNFLKLLPGLKKQQASLNLNHCNNCGEPSSKELCRACNLVDTLTPAIKSVMQH